MSDEWRTITVFGRDILVLDWLDFLGIGMVLLAVALGSFAVAVLR